MATGKNGTGRAARPRPKQLHVANHVHIGLDVLPPADRESVLAAIASWDAFRVLLPTARATGPQARLRLARVTPTLDLVYRETPTRVDVLDLVSGRTLDALGVETVAIEPGRRM